MLFSSYRQLFSSLCLTALLCQLAADTRGTWSHFGALCVSLSGAREFETQTPRFVTPPRLRPLQPCTRRHAHQEHQRGVHFHPSPFTLPLSHHSATSLTYTLNNPPHPAQFISAHRLLRLSSPHASSLFQTHLPPPRTPFPSIPQLWFRRQGCSHSLPAPDQLTLPLLSRSPGEGASCQAERSLLTRLSRTCRLAEPNHRRPWSVEPLQPWHRLPGK